MNVWDEVLAHIRGTVNGEDFRRWFASTTYASDSGDQIVVWVPTEPIRQHLLRHFRRQMTRALEAVGRSDAQIRFVVAGISEDEDEEEE